MRMMAPLYRASAVLILLLSAFHASRDLRAEPALTPHANATNLTDDEFVDPIGSPETELADPALPFENEYVDELSPGPITVDQKPIDADYFASRQDDVWLISTRHLGCSAGKSGGVLDLDVSHYSPEAEWMTADLNELLTSDPRLTIVYVHGNQVDFDDAITRGWNALRVLQADPSAPPMRLVIWSWPSDKIPGLVRDVRRKGARTNTEGQYLGWFLSQLDPSTPVSLIGYSYGARVVSGAMHVLGGGTLVGQASPLPYSQGGRSPIQVILLAAAVHNYWLSAGGYHDQFWNFADRLLVLYNSCDPILKRYRFIEKRSRPAALGYTGTWGLDESQANQTEQFDVCCSVGRTHTEAVFFSSAEVIETIQRNVLWNIGR